MKILALLYLAVLVSCSDDSNNASNNASNNSSNNSSNNTSNNSSNNSSNNASNNASNNSSNNGSNNTSDAGTDASLDASNDDAGIDTGDDMSAGTHPGCQTDADCGGGTCQPLGTPSEWHVCVSTIEAPGDDCDKNGVFPAECCSATECTTGTGGVCVLNTRFYCGGAQPMETYVCQYDGCDAQNPCGEGEICLPAGAFGEATARCVVSECTADADCDARAGGQCTGLYDPCRGRFAGFSCTYDDSPCRTDDDCTGAGPGIQYCYDAGDDTACGQFFPPA